MSNGKFTCPYCYGEHTVADCGLKCSYNLNNGTTVKKCKFDVGKYDDTNGYDWIPQANKKKCLSCKEAAKQLFCSSNNKEIPIEFLSMRSLPIALLGAKASGKSNYIGVLINEIRKKMSRPFNCSLSMTCSKESKEAYDEKYYRPLFSTGQINITTAAGEVPPLIFPLKFMKKNKITNMAALTFYDTAGENLDDNKMMENFNNYIANAKGIILLLDPLQVTNIRNKLTANGLSVLPPQNSEIYDVLDRIINIIRRINNLKGKIKIPLALAFTKIDVLEEFNLLPEGSCLRDESDHISRGAFMQHDFENTNKEMEKLIDNWLDDELISKIDEFEQHSFFGLTSLGISPINNPNNSKGINPRRVLDPLLWLLAKYKIISTLKK